MEQQKSDLLLMSFDLEDARLFSEDGKHFPSRVELNTLKFLEFLKIHKLPCTFFTVGHIFNNHPDLIREIVNQGYEIAWHSDKHDPVSKLSEAEFNDDLKKARHYSDLFNIEMIGYRAPMFSVNESVSWVHKALNNFNFKYSSSVLSARNPLHGWTNFGEKPRVVESVMEIPITLLDFKLLKVPFGGTYLRVFPNCMLNHGIKAKKKNKQPITIYLHPYDLDDKQERYIHGGVNGNSFYNWLMYYNRKATLSKIQKLISLEDFQVTSYKQFFQQHQPNTI